MTNPDLRGMQRDDTVKSSVATGVMPVAVDALDHHGLAGITRLGTVTIRGALTYERPAMLYDPRRLTNSTFGAFSYINGHGSTAVYFCEVGRYCSIGEDSVLGPPEHPDHWLTTHPFAFARPQNVPAFYKVQEFADLAQDADEPWPFPPRKRTTLGHDVWIGANAFVKRGVHIGNGAIVAAHAVVTRDVPPYAIVVGTPAKTMRLRFPEATVERLQSFAWWQYDLAPHKKTLDLSKIDSALDSLERLRDDDQLQALTPETWRVTRTDTQLSIERLDRCLY